MRVFEIIGPSMIGPSSSHTAGACRLGWAARALLDEPPETARIELHGSFLATGDGHGTKEALTAGLLGLAPDDERLIQSPELARAEGLAIHFGEVDLGPQAHPNTARIHLKGSSRQLSLTGASVGGGSVCIQEVDGLPVEIRGTLETLVLWHQDTPGFLARITAVLACVQINVASIRTSRLERGENAITAIEVDGSLPDEVSALLRKTPAIARFTRLPVLPGS